MNFNLTEQNICNKMYKILEVACEWRNRSVIRTKRYMF